MALTGTLKDFGIADILQLIGQQAKSGVLPVRDKSDEIHVVMSNGCVVSAEYAGRRSRDRLGSLLVRGAVITQAQLDEALAAQRRTLRRLGDILVEQRSVSRDDLKEMTALQTTQTVYKLFQWKSGTYDFEPREVQFDRQTVTPLRCESVLMEGFRIVDEWPMVRRKISSPAMTFERVRLLDEDSAAVGRNERRAYELAEHGRTVEAISDLSRLGEFEAAKALFNLVNLGVLRPVAPSRRSAALEVGAYARSWRDRLREGAARLLATAAIAVALAALAVLVLDRGRASGGLRPLRDDGTLRFVARYELERIRSALEVYRLERGAYPTSLGALVDEGLLRTRDLAYPWSRPYWYRQDGDGYRLLPPVE
jgi:hypothetical protein